MYFSALTKFGTNHQKVFECLVPAAAEFKDLNVWSIVNQKQILGGFIEDEHEGAESPVIHQQPDRLAAQRAVWLTVGDARPNRWLTSPQCILGVLGHGIGLVQYHQLEALPGGQNGSRLKKN